MMAFEAVQLFVARVHQHRPTFPIDSETTGPIIDICRRLDGLPLAIELAAATLRWRLLQMLASDLREERNWLQTFRSPARDLPPRQLLGGEIGEMFLEILARDLGRGFG